MLPEKKGAGAAKKNHELDDVIQKVAARPHLRYSKTDYAAACLATVLVKHGLPAPHAEIRKKLNASLCSDDVINFLDVAESYGLEGRPMVLTSVEWQNIPSHSILHWGPDHLVVFESYVGNVVVINDPSSGTRRVEMKEFRRQFTGIVLLFEPCLPRLD